MASEHLASVMVEAFIAAVDAGLDVVPVVASGGDEEPASQTVAVKRWFCDPAMGA